MQKSGYAILFTVIIVSIISIITIGLANTTYKQLLLSSLARDSTIAFYQADIGAECALYADSKNQFSGSGGSFSCADQTLNIVQESSNTWKVNPPNENATNKCFRVSVAKTTSGDKIDTVVISEGYNICNKSSSRTVQRTIKVTY